MVRCVSRWLRGGLGGVGCLGFFSRTFHVVVGLEAPGGLSGVKAVFRRSRVLGAVVSVLMVSRSALEQGAVRPEVFTPAGRSGAVGVSWWPRGGLGGIRRGSGSSHGHGHSMVWCSPSRRSRVLREIPCWSLRFRWYSGLFQCCWSRVQCWVWCDENLSACDSEEARCSGCRAIRRSEQAPCVKNTIHQQPVNGPHSMRIRVSDPWVSWYHLLPLVRIERFA